MAALRGLSRLVGSGAVGLQRRRLLRDPNPNPSLLPSQLVCRRGAASKLFVGGISFYTTEETLSEAFSQFGQVVEATIVTDKVTDKSKGFGFVTFASEDEAQKAIAEMNGKALNGRVIFVDKAKIRSKFFYDDSPPPIARGPPQPVDKNESR